MLGNPVLDIIINILENTTCCLDGESGADRVECTYDGRAYTLWNANYLLGQIIRQYRIPESNFYISKRAQELWHQISDDDTWNYSYRSKIIVQNEATVITYKGASSDGEQVTLGVGENFVFNDVFHDEHIVPINVIIKKLKSLESYNYENVSQILDQICVCRMLKEEDRRIKEKSKRPCDVKIVVDEIYAKYGIEIVEREGK